MNAEGKKVKWRTHWGDGREKMGKERNIKEKKEYKKLFEKKKEKERERMKEMKQAKTIGTDK